MDPLHRELLSLRKRIAEMAAAENLEPEPGESAKRFYQRALEQRAARLVRPPSGEVEPNRERDQSVPGGLGGKSHPDPGLPPSPPRRAVARPSPHPPPRRPARKVLVPVSLVLAVVVLGAAGVAAWIGVGGPAGAHGRGDTEEPWTGLERAYETGASSGHLAALKEELDKVDRMIAQARESNRLDAAVESRRDSLLSRINALEALNLDAVPR
jgi:hypothetical protein